MKFKKRKEIDKDKNVIAESCWFLCPGCNQPHRIIISCKAGGPIWNWNGSEENPTVNPSILVGGKDFKEMRCHSFIKDGKIRFLNDCHHDLKGQTVELPDVPDWI